MTHHYFISYSYSDHHGFGFGNSELRLEEPIRTHADVQGIETLLRQHGVSNPVVSSFTRFHTEAEQDSTAASGPVDGIVFDYIRELLTAHNHPLTADRIAELLGFPIIAVRRVVTRAVQAGRLTATGNTYTVTTQHGRGRS
jgi:hypothetical protein